MYGPLQNIQKYQKFWCEKVNKNLLKLKRFLLKKFWILFVSFFRMDLSAFYFTFNFRLSAKAKLSFSGKLLNDSSNIGGMEQKLIFIIANLCSK